jgi:hypothetical protein
VGVDAVNKVSAWIYFITGKEKSREVSMVIMEKE